MDSKRLQLLEEWYQDYSNPSVEGHIKELINEVRKLNAEIERKTKCPDCKKSLSWCECNEVYDN